MKKSLRALTLGLTAATMLAASAAAADFEHCADTLHNLGLFSGGSSGYELDKAPTRAQAATMLVRLLGKEAEAKALTYTAPFTDLKGWEQPYVQYLYDNGLASGLTATTFGPDANCNAQMYTTFLLRALGYSDANGDFTYATALDKAKEISLVDLANCNEANFLRDHVAAMSLTALNTAPKGKENTTLLDQLVSTGAIAAETAKPTQEFFNNYKTLLTATNPNKYAMDFSMKAAVKLNGQDAMNIALDMNAKADMNMTEMDKSKLAMTGTMKMDINKDMAKEMGATETSMNANIAYYYTDAMYYMNMDGEKMKAPMSFDAAMSSIGGITSASAQPISMIKSLTGKDNSYSMTYSGNAMNSMATSMLATMGQAQSGMNMTIGDISMNYTLKDGYAQDMSLKMPMSMSVEGETMDMTMDMTMKITETGDTVVVTLPTDLSSYPEVPGAMS